MNICLRLPAAACVLFVVEARQVMRVHDDIG